MKIFINNQETTAFADGCVLADVLAQYNDTGKGMAAAVDNKGVAKTAWGCTALHDGDRITIISAVCGG